MIKKIIVMCLISSSIFGMNPERNLGEDPSEKYLTKKTFKETLKESLSHQLSPSALLKQYLVSTLWMSLHYRQNSLKDYLKQGAAALLIATGLNLVKAPATTYFQSKIGNNYQNFLALVAGTLSVHLPLRHAFMSKYNTPNRSFKQHLISGIKHGGIDLAVFGSIFGAAYAAYP